MSTTSEIQSGTQKVTPDNGEPKHDGELVEDAVSRVLNTFEMFNLPNRPPLTRKTVQRSSKQLRKQYDIAVKRDVIGLIKSKIMDLLHTSEDHYQKAQEILEIAPQEAAPGLAANLYYLPEESRVEIAHLLIDKALLEAAPGLAWNLHYLPEESRVEIAHLLIDKALLEAAPGLAANLYYLPEESRVEIAHLLIDKALLEAAPGLAWNFEYLPEESRVEIAHLLIDKALLEAAPGLAANLYCLPEESRVEIAHLLIDKAPQEAAPGLAWNLYYLPEESRVEIAHLLIDKAPQEAAPGLAKSLKYLPEKIQVKIAYSLIDKAPKEFAPELAWNLEYLPKVIQVKIAHFALKKAPKEFASGLAWNLGYLPEDIQVKIAYLLIDKAPQEAAPGLAGNLEYLPEEIREEIENEVKQIAQVVEREKLSQAEKRNPVLYKGVDSERFLRRPFPKSGTKTLLLGYELINNAILRIIPDHAFISWMKAYSATDVWKEAGFDYVPVEPIIRAYTSRDGKNTRVYTGVLGVSVSAYLNMYSNKNYHDYVKKQVEKIISVLNKMGIDHGHAHNDNFCILHERTPEGEIDWDRPPRVYCIDFDESVSS